MKRLSWLVVVSLATLSLPLAAQEWPQWSLNAQHTGSVRTSGQNLYQNFVNLQYDFVVDQEMSETFALYGESVLLAHFQAPLIDGNDAYMMTKSGPYNIHNYGTQKWGETKFTWQNGTLVPVWTFDSDWKAVGSLLKDFWEPVFHPALANGSLYVPGAGGTIFRVSKTTGAGSRINPFAQIKSNVFTASPISADSKGNLYYNVIEFSNATDIFQNDVVDSWLVKVDKFDHVTTASYAAITAGAKSTNDLCLTTFVTRADGTIVDGPWPPSPTAVPASAPCGTQRPGFNVAPAITTDGKTLYTVSRAHFNSRFGYLVAVNTSNLSQKWISTLRERFRDGCGVPFSLGGTLPPNGAPGGCRAGANYGVDPATNTYGGGRVLDDQSSVPVIAPDGSIIFGAFSRYNYDQGHMMRFSSSGEYLGGYFFGWDVTPGIYPHGGSFSIVTKENRYGELGSYCNDPAFCPDDAALRLYPEEYFVTQLSPTVRADALADRGDKIMTVEWRFKNTNTLACSRDANGSVSCVSDHPNSFEWCVNAFVIDSGGNVYANSEDGWLYKIQQGGIVNDAACNPPSVTACGGKIFQQLALGAAYTPTSMDAMGRIYSQNAGHLFVAGN